MMRFLHRLLERACCRVVYRQVCALRTRDVYRAPWWFRLASRVEFWLRERIRSKRASERLS